MKNSSRTRDDVHPCGIASEDNSAASEISTDAHLPRFRVEIDYMTHVRWSLLRIGIPIVRSLTIQTLKPLPQSQQVDIPIRVEIPGFFDSGRLSLTAVAGSAGKPPWDQSPEGGGIDFSQAMCLAQERRTRLQLQVGRYHADFPITLLTADEWCPGVTVHTGANGLRCTLDSELEWARVSFDLPPSGSKAPETFLTEPWEGWAVSQPGRSPGGASEPTEWLPLQAALGVLVQPEHELIEELGNDVRRSLPALTGDPQPSQIALVQGSPDSRRLLAQACYVALAESLGKAVHCLPRLSLQARSQRIRLASQFMGRDSLDRRPSGTCVDYAVLFAALLKHCGLDPLLLLIAIDQATCHAMVGCWLDPPQEIELIETDGVKLNRQREEGALLIVDVTLITGRASFDKACQTGAELLRGQDPQCNPLCYALDVTDLWDRGIKPLPLEQCAKTDHRRWRFLPYATLLVTAGILAALFFPGRPPPPPPCDSVATTQTAIRELEYGRLQSASERITEFLAGCPPSSQVQVLADQLGTAMRARVQLEIEPAGWLEGEASSQDAHVVRIDRFDIAPATIRVSNDSPAFRLTLTPSESAYAYLFGIDSGDVVETLFPNPADNEAPKNPLGADLTYALPSSDPLAGYELRQDGHPVNEAVLVVSPWRARELEGAGVKARGAEARSLRDALDAREATGQAPWLVARLQFERP